MKLIHLTTLAIIALAFNPMVSLAQEEPISKAYKEAAIERLSQLMNDFYVFPEVAEKTAKHLNAQWEEGHFDSFKDDKSFADALTTSVQSINKDKHMRIRVNPPYEAPDNSPERIIEERLHQINRSRTANAGFSKVKLLDGNVGYLDLRGFAGLERGKDLADASMQLLSSADAIIIDLTKNGGGSPRMVQYLCSYFFDGKVHLNSLYWREGDRTEEFWTLDEVGGERMPDVPLFVMTSSYTFSGAEEFSYNMQTQKRATLVGQTTGGGANPGGMRPINENLSVFIPGGRAINPITKTNWEGVGVVPEVKVSGEETMDKTHELAKKAAEEYRAKRKELYTQTFNNLLPHLDKYTAGQSEENILHALRKCEEAGLFEEWNINALGYDYLLQHKKPNIAASVFKANIMLHPNSSNVYDSYAECLMMNGDLKGAVKHYQKAVEVARKNEDRDLPFYQRNLENAKKKLEDKK